MPQPLYPIASIPHAFVDTIGMKALYDYCTRDTTGIALIGFNEYAKHLINLCGENIVGIYDPAEWKIGIAFRGIPVVRQTQVLEIRRIVICDRLLALDFADEISVLYDDRISLFCPPSLDGKAADWTNPFEQEHIYKAIFDKAAAAPLTMMAREKICYLMEMLRFGLGLPGDVIEMGVWQGGSAWYLAQVLSYLGEQRELVLIDQFENLAGTRNATVCTDEVRSALRFYPNVNLLAGLVNDRRILSGIDDRVFCFAHYDLGFIPLALDYIWQRLAPGAPLILDNYGLFGGLPGRHDRFFAARGARVIRMPWSGQGLVFKR